MPTNTTTEQLQQKVIDEFDYSNCEDIPVDRLVALIQRENRAAVLEVLRQVKNQWDIVRPESELPHGVHYLIPPSCMSTYTKVNIKKEVLEEAKKIASEQHRSVSNLIEMLILSYNAKQPVAPSDTL